MVNSLTMNYILAIKANELIKEFGTPLMFTVEWFPISISKIQKCISLRLTIRYFMR